MSNRYLEIIVPKNELLIYLPLIIYATAVHGSSVLLMTRIRKPGAINYSSLHFSLLSHTISKPSADPVDH